jgi:mRNA (guanine-N7-)-methyltransferase
LELVRYNSHQTYLLDIADVSVEQAMERHRTMRGKQFPASFYTLDCFSESIVPKLKSNERFDFVSAQFCIHYAFDSEERVRMLLKNVTDRLRPGGVFVATVPDAYWIAYVAVNVTYSFVERSSEIVLD